MGRRERMRDAEASVRDAEALVAAGWPVQLSSGEIVTPQEYLERARMALREAVLLAEANTSVGHQYFAMPHGWTHWAADAPHTTACSSVAKVEDWHG